MFETQTMRTDRFSQPLHYESRDLVSDEAIALEIADRQRQDDIDRQIRQAEEYADLFDKVIERITKP